MTLNLVIGRFFTAKLGDYTLVVSCRKLTNVCFLVSNIIWYNPWGAKKFKFERLLIFAGISLALIISKFFIGLDLISSDGLDVVVWAFITMIVFFAGNWFLGVGESTGKRLLLANVYVQVAIFAHIIATILPPEELSGEGDVVVHTTAYGVLVGLCVALKHWSMVDKGPPP